MEQLLSAQEVSQTLGLPLQRVYELTRRGILPAVRVLRQYRYSPSKLEEWIDKGGTIDQKHNEQSEAA